MKISDIVKSKTSISFEVFPPKKDDKDINAIYRTVDELSKLNPDFISVTYGAGGSTIGSTVKISSYIKNELNIESLAHLTCVSSSREDIINICKELKSNNVENVLALRGDYPNDYNEDKHQLNYASDLIKFIHDEFDKDFCLAGACYPETHQEAESFHDDLIALKHKVDQGAQFLITQIFFDNNYYYRLVKEARKLGIKVPIIAGIMPITNAKQLLKTAKLCGCSIPYELSTMLEKYFNNSDAMKEIGINYATKQIIDLITNGVDGIHIYTMNKPAIAKSIFNAIPSVLKEIDNEH